MTLHQRRHIRRRHARSRGLTYIDLIVLLLCVGLGVLVGCYTGGRSRETANRVKCASQLRSLGQAILLYSNDNRGALPRVTYLRGPNPKPVWGTGAGGKNPFVDVEPNDRLCHHVPPAPHAGHHV